MDLAKLGVRTTVHAGEPGAGIPSVRARIEALWGARAYDHAGMTEMGAYGFGVRGPGGTPRQRDRVRGRGDRSRERSGHAGGGAGALEPGPARIAAAPLPHRGSRASGHGSLSLRPDVPASRRGLLGRVDDMLVVRGVNVFPSALEGIVRRFPTVDEFMIEVYRRHEMDEVRLLLEVSGGGDIAAQVQRRCASTSVSVSKSWRFPRRASPLGAQGPPRRPPHRRLNPFSTPGCRGWISRPATRPRRAAVRYCQAGELLILMAGTCVRALPHPPRPPICRPYRPRRSRGLRALLRLACEPRLRPDSPCAP